jgi:hypothetical protein
MDMALAEPQPFGGMASWMDEGAMCALDLTSRLALTGVSESWGPDSSGWKNKHVDGGCAIDESIINI